MYGVLFFAVFRGGIDVGMVLGDFRLATEPLGFVPLKAYARASAFILLSCSGSNGTEGVYIAG